jgi:predicted CXXCH cytochrome family protein
MKKLFILSLAAALVGLAIAPSAFAGIGGSRHDMTNAAVATKYNTTLATFDKYGSCSACHIPHGAGGARLFPKTVAAANSGFFGPLCQTCHDSTITTHTDLVDNNTVLNGAHGLSISTLSALGAHQTVATSNLPYTGSAGFPVITANSIECLSCHDVHNQNSFRPFLNVTLDNLCEACHSNRVNNVATTTGWANNAGGTGSTHPAGPLFTGDISGIATAPNSPITLTASATAGINQNPDTAPNGSTWTDGVWNSGMHLSSQGAVGTGGVDCITCHTVHWDENAATPNNGTAYLAAVDDGGGTTVNNTFCEYCHRGAAITGYTAVAGEYPNPGGQPYTHPNDGYSGGNAARLNVALAWQPATSSPLVGTGASTLVCTSCHGVHPQGATSQTQLNTPILLNYGAAGSVCNACHTQTGAYSAWNHHPVGTGVYATSGNAAGGVTCAGGNLAPGLNKCHGSGGGTTNGGWFAHNRTSPLGNPGTTASQTCMDCHTNNPSTYTPANTYTANGTATHFVGAAEAETWNNGRTTEIAPGTIRYAATATSAAGTANATNWAASTLPSYFGATADTIICESCHRLAAGNVRTGDGATGLLVEVSGSAINGGAVGAYAYGTNPYLCSGCHLVPGGTHPLAGASQAAYAIGGAAQGESYMGTGLNCESCHSPHDAATSSGSYILDGTTVGAYGAGSGMEVEPTIDYTTFCAVCHATFQ